MNFHFNSLMDVTWCHDTNDLNLHHLWSDIIKDIIVPPPTPLGSNWLVNFFIQMPLVSTSCKKYKWTEIDKIVVNNRSNVYMWLFGKRPFASVTEKCWQQTFFPSAYLMYWKQVIDTFYANLISSKSSISQPCQL